MKELLEYILEGITGSKNFEIVESVGSDDTTNFINIEIKADPKIIGLIIGKSGNTIRAIRNLLRVRATLEKKGISVSVSEKQIA